MVMPGTVRSASDNEAEAVSLINCPGMTVTVRGVSRSGAANFGESAFSV